MSDIKAEDLDHQQRKAAEEIQKKLGVIRTTWRGRPSISWSTPRTLADMHPEEREACVGMWCDNLVSAAKEPMPVVLACVQGEQCWVLHTNIHGEPSCFSLESVAPRFDMPRAWNPDGTPPHGEWVDAAKPATDLLEAMWEAADEGANAAIDAGDTDAADRAVMRQEIIADLIDNLKESL